MNVAQIKKNVVDTLLGQYNGSTKHVDGNPLSALLRQMQNETLTTQELVEWTQRCCAKSRKLFALQGIRVSEGEMQFVRAYIAGMAAGLYGYDDAEARRFLEIVLHTGSQQGQFLNLYQLGFEHGASVGVALLDFGIMPRSPKGARRRSNFQRTIQ